MLTKAALIFTVIFSSVFSFAVDESMLASRFIPQLVPYVLKNFQRGQFIGADGIKINYYFQNREDVKGVIIVSPGQSESSLKYAELLYDLKDSGYALYIIDHRGQGESGRMLVDTTRSHVNRFSDYVDDFETFVNTVVQPQLYKKSFILAHSMGGTVASGYLVKNPFAVSGVILCAPMMEIDTGLVGALGADILANVLKFAGFSTQLAPKQKPYDPNEKFEDNRVTSSPVRFKMKKDLYNLYPQLRVGGTSVNWVKESLAYSTGLRQTPDIYRVPTILLQATNDTYVKARGENQACAVLSPLKCKVVKFEGSKHEILMEKDVIRNNAMTVIQEFIASVP